MNKLDEMSLDGRLLSMFLAVYETGSVTEAALALNVTQSTVSHSLNRLREITKDRLFVPLGRGITPTEKADILVNHARSILKDMERFSSTLTYDPAMDEQPFTIAATDYEIQILVKPFINRLRVHAPKVQVRIERARADREWVELLRSGDVNLVLAPELRTMETDIKQRRVIENDVDICYYDPDLRKAPNTIDAYCQADHVIMAPAKFRNTKTDTLLAELGYHRRIAVSVPSFSSVASILKGTDLVALMPQGLKHSLFADLASCPPPFPGPKETISCIWHSRVDASLRHKWMRSQLQKSEA